MKQNAPLLNATGVPGLDEILKGGLPANRLYLVRGAPGVGKTTLSMQFLLEGEKRGEKGLYVTLSETKIEIEDIAISHGWNLGKLAIFELSAMEQEMAEDAQNTIFHPSEIELNKTTEMLLRKIEQAKPKRIVLDSMSELRLLSDSPLRYRRQMLALKQFFVGRDMTVLLLDDHAAGGDLQVQSIAHGVISIETITSDYGAERRRLKVDKMRGVNFMGGYHDSVIVPGGLHVFPRLVAAEHNKGYKTGQIKSGLDPFDKMLGGGIDRGTSCLFLGPAGCGKSSLMAQYAVAAAERGEKSLVFLFEETKKVSLARSKSLGMPVQKYIDKGLIDMRQLDPGDLAPGQFVDMVISAVERDNIKLVQIDSLNGYLQAMPDVKFLNIQFHELLTFLSHRGVVTLMTVAQQGLMGSTMTAPVEITYLADSVVMMRYFEHGGEIKKAVSILKKRVGKHESTIREFQASSQGLLVGEALREFHGVLTGTPVFKGADGAMLGKKKMTSNPASDRRVLVVAPSGKDGRNSVAVLEKAGFKAEALGNVATAVEEARHGCGTLLVTEEALAPAHRSLLRTMLANQPKWSNLPVVLITSGGLDKKDSKDVRRGFDPKVPVTVLERPLRTTTLVAAVEAALGSRDQQYEIRDLWLEREAMLNSLEERVKERTVKLQAMMQEMEAFSYSVSHDLRAPLRVIAGYADVVQEDYARKLPPEGQRLLEKISKAAKRMDRMTQELLAYTRIASGDINLEEVDIDVVIDGVIESYPSVQQIKEHITIRKPLGKCLGHGPSLEQCFSNLLENAVKFAKPGEHPKIHIFAAKKGNRLRISILDHGVGIDPGETERIFGLFERGVTNAPGTGIGLAIVKKGAERMQGEVGLVSVRGQKTEFWIELKVMPE